MEKIKNLKNKFINTCKKIKEEHLISKYIKNNKIFVFFVLVNVINSTLLRILTMPNAENIFALKPIIADLAMVIIIGSFNYLFRKGKSQVIYLSIITFICKLFNAFFDTVHCACRRCSCRKCFTD